MSRLAAPASPFSLRRLSAWGVPGARRAPGPRTGGMSAVRRTGRTPARTAAANAL
ncbi:hypothetical protein DP56_6182 [Burkholderia pseudomallei]|nr:hypothetical protein DP56_6182 [Burkholderia pseudomallei]